MRRIRIALACFGALALAACSLGGGTVQSASSVAATTADAVGVPKPTPCRLSSIDEKSISIVATALDTIALAAPSFATAGSPRALAIADALDKARNAVNAAAAARLACNAGTYAAAVDEMNRAIADVQLVLK